MQVTEKLLQSVYSKEKLADREEMEITYRFVEVLTFSTKEQILEMLDYQLGKDFLALPVWVRNLAFRLACLQDPSDRELLKRAGYDLSSFGPDWDVIAKKLIKEGNA